MARVLIVSLGQLSGAVLEALARDPRFSEIVVATRNKAHAIAKLNAVRIGAALEGLYPRIEFVAFDFGAADAAKVLRQIAPDLAFVAPSLMPWWRIDRSEAARRVTMPFGGWIAFHLAPMLRFREAWAQSGLSVPWIGASYPDVVNAILHMTGPGPISGVGNVGECVPKIVLAATSTLGAKPEELSVRLVAQHALEYYFYSERTHQELPPFLLQVLWHGHDVTAKIRDLMRRKMPIPYDLDFNRITASASVDLLAALLGDGPKRLHVPAPNGLIGGYPVIVSKSSIAVDLAPDWTIEQAIAINAQSLAWDGIAAIEKDGTALFAEPTVAAIRRLTGAAIDRLAPEGAQAMAEKLLHSLQG